MKLGRITLAALAALVLAGVAHAAVHATLDPLQVATGEPVHLTLTYDGQTRDQPDLAPLQQDFDILSTSRGTSIQMINGSLSSHTEIQVMLSPKRTGQILVPQIPWGSELSNPLTLTVAAAGAAGAAGAPPQQNVFLETIVDTHEPYVQAAVNVIVRVYAGERLLQAGLEFAGTGDVLMQQVGPDRNRQLEKNGQLYDVVERHYALFPQKSGELKIPGALLSGQVVVRLRQNPQTTDPFADLFGAAGMSAGTRPIRLHGDDLVLNVRPRPAGSDPRYWLPARSITLQETWRPDGAEVHVGDPVTRDLHLRAEGLTAAQLPDLAALMSMPDGVKAYPDQAKLDNAAAGDVVVGTRDQSVAMIADHAGTIELPALRLAWWDTGANAERVVTLPAHKVTVLPAAGGTPAAATNPAVAVASPATPSGAASPATASGPGAGVAGARRDPWAWATLGFALLWMLTLAAWALSRVRGAPPGAARAKLRKPEPLTPAQARARFQAACRQDDAHAARHALLAWAEVAWPRSPPAGLEALARLLGDSRVETLLVELDRALYRGAPWNGAPLAAAVQELPPRGAGSGSGGDDGGLAPLYR